jgi:hypothetical protein
MPDQCVEKRGFASLELTDTGYIESSFGNPRCKLSRFLCDVLSPKLLSQSAESQQTGGAIRG